MDFDDDDDEDFAEIFNLALQQGENSCDIIAPQKYLDVLKTSFGHSSFRPMQWKVIKSVLEDKRDNCVVMATGYGKSLCYQFPAVYSNGITLVVSPLISLMEDQVISLTVSNIPACFLGSAQSNKSIVYDIYRGHYRIVYVTPEYVTGESGELFLTSIEKLVVLIGIDEAHCVSQWGHDFRGAFRNLSIIRKFIPNAPILAVTATATERVRDDIIKSLKLNNPQILCTGFDRPNLQFFVHLKGQFGIWHDLKKYLLTHSHGSAIVYCITRKSTEEVATVLKEQGINCEAYHAGLTIKQRRDAHELFVKDKIHVIVATIAFGMGIDKPDVRLVIHYGSSKDLESYYQEVGRAGRDNHPSKCIVFYNRLDFDLHKTIRESNQRISTQSKENLNNLSKKMMEYLDSHECRRLLILRYFEGPNACILKKPKNCCDNCIRKESGRDDSDIYENINTNGLYNFTDDAILLMEAIQALNERTGLGLPILLLRGSRVKKLNEKLYSHRLHGAGKLKSEEWWKLLGVILERENLIKKENLSNGTYNKMYRIYVTPKGSDWLNNSESCQLNLKPMAEMYQFLKKKKVDPLFELKAEGGGQLTNTTQFFENHSRSNAVADVKKIIIQDPEIELVNYLRKALLEARIDLANKTNAMPYMIASNTAIGQLAKMKPKTLDEMRECNLHGFNEAKINAFGPFFIQFIDEKLDAYGGNSNTLEKALQICPLPGLQKRLTETKRQAHLMWSSGMTVTKIAEQKSIAESTVFDYLNEAIKGGLEFTKKDLERCGIDEHLFNQIYLKIPSNPLDVRLKELKESLPPIYSYDMIKFVLSYTQIRYHLKNSNVPFIDPDKVIIKSEVKLEENVKTEMMIKSENIKTEIQSNSVNSTSLIDMPSTSSNLNPTSSNELLSSDDEIFFEEIDDIILSIDSKNSQLQSSNDYDDDNESTSSIDQMELSILQNVETVIEENNISTDMSDNEEFSEDFLNQIEMCEENELKKSPLKLSQSNVQEAPKSSPLRKIQPTIKEFLKSNEKKKQPIRIVPTKKIKYANSSDDDDDGGNVRNSQSNDRALPNWLSQSSASGSSSNKGTRKFRKNMF